MKILGPPSLKIETAQAWARSRGATDVFVLLADLYWRFGPERGVKPEIAYAQSGKETAFGRFGGVVTPQYRNPCGLKTTSGGLNTDPDAHQRFPTWEVGVQAHLDHLALYAGALGYPREDTPDPRHFASILGAAPTVEMLSGNWAGTGYGESLLELYVGPLLAFPAPAPPPPPPEYVTRESFDAALDEGGEHLEDLKRLIDDVRGEMRSSISNLITTDVLTDKEVEELRAALGELQRAIHDAGQRLMGTI